MKIAFNNKSHDTQVYEVMCVKVGPKGLDTTITAKEQTLEAIREKHCILGYNIRELNHDMWGFDRQMLDLGATHEALYGQIEPFTIIDNS